MSAPVQFEGRVEEITYSEGWTDETLLALALEFIGDRPETSEAFLAFLESRTYVAEDSEPDDSMDGDHESALESVYGPNDGDDGSFGDLD
jgi:hypothetical protein